MNHKSQRTPLKFRPTVIIIALISTLFIYSRVVSCETSIKKYKVNLTTRIDSDIVLVNMGNADRRTIGELLLSINRCNPIVIGINAYFINQQNSLQDSLLINALDTIQNDVISYIIDSSGTIVKSNDRFGSSARDQGLVHFEQKNGLLNATIPLKRLDKVYHESFALKVIKQWKPQFEVALKKDEKIPINFTSTLDQFWHFDYSEIISAKFCEFLRDKVILLGYLGPGYEDKHFTPIRIVKEYKSNEPDTYGLVIIANEIRTILDYEKK